MAPWAFAVTTPRMLESIRRRNRVSLNRAAASAWNRSVCKRSSQNAASHTPIRKTQEVSIAYRASPSVPEYQPFWVPKSLRASMASGSATEPGNIQIAILPTSVSLSRILRGPFSAVRPAIAIPSRMRTRHVGRAIPPDNASPWVGTAPTMYPVSARTPTPQPRSALSCEAKRSRGGAKLRRPTLKNTMPSDAMGVGRVLGNAPAEKGSSAKKPRSRGYSPR